MRRAADPQNRAAYRNTSVTISGSGFDWHDVDHYFRPNAIGRYSFDDQNNIVFNKFDKLFDVAIMMDCSQCPVHPQLGAIFTEFAKKSTDAARKNGAKPVFFMSWAYADKPEMTAQLAEAYTLAGNENDAFVIPVGLAFARSVAQAAEAQSLRARQAASEHARNVSLGRHGLCFALSAKRRLETPILAGIDAETARFLQTIAWETAQDYYGKSAQFRRTDGLPAWNEARKK